jgi:hypothetical protein
MVKADTMGEAESEQLRRWEEPVPGSTGNSVSGAGLGCGSDRWRELARETVFRAGVAGIEAAGDGTTRGRLSFWVWARLGVVGLGELPVAKVRRDSAMSNERKERRPTGRLPLGSAGSGVGWRERGWAELQRSMRPLVKSEE